MDRKLTNARREQLCHIIKANMKQFFTQIKMCCCSVTVQFGVKFFILAVHFDSFSVEVNGAVEILLVVFVVTLILVNLCNCYNEGNQLTFGISNFRFNKNGKLWLLCVQNVRRIFIIALS